MDYHFSPDRINLIGEHIDYNGGRVFPCAITQGTYGAVKLRQDQAIRVYLMNLHEPGVIEFRLDELAYHNAHSWTNYVKGMLDILLIKGFELSYGFGLVVYGDIPNAEGLSSLASLELLIGVIAEALCSLKLD